nr:hypothetical protein [Streptomyces sp. QL37]
MSSAPRDAAPLIAPATPQAIGPRQLADFKLAEAALRSLGGGDIGAPSGVRRVGAAADGAAVVRWICCPAAAGATARRTCCTGGVAAREPWAGAAWDGGMGGGLCAGGGD